MIACVVALGGVPVVPAAAASTPGDWSSTSVTFYFGLKRPDARARAALWRRSDPDDPTYRKWLTVRDVRTRFGATKATRATVREYFEGLGLSVVFDQARTFAMVSGQVGTWERAFGVRIDVTSLDIASDFAGYGFRMRRPPQLPRAVADRIPQGEQVWEYQSAAGSSHVARATPRNSGQWLNGCRAARTAGGRRGTYAFDQVRMAYGFERVARAVDEGRGVRVGLVTVGEGVDAPSLRRAQRCWGWPSRPLVRRPSIGMRRNVVYEPSGEAALDAQMVRGFLPRATIVNYLAWDSPVLWFLAYSAVIADPQRPDVVSLSYGGLPAPGGRLLDSQVLRLGLLGVTSVVAAGDAGAVTFGKLRVKWPARVQYFLTVGGSRLVLDEDNRRVAEVAWNDNAFGESSASTGGRIRNVGKPFWQRASGTHRWKGRLVPDVAAHASSFPGWPQVLVIGRNVSWANGGGTSASAPLVATELAAINRMNERAGSRPMGYVAPALYAAQRRQAGTFFDVVNGTNKLPPGRRGYRALPGFDLVTGLGVPQADTLAKALR